MASAIWRLGLTVFALVQQASVKIGIALARGLCSLFLGICSQAIWRIKVKPEVQGRVLAARFLLTQLAISLAAVISELLAEHMFDLASKVSEHCRK